VSWKVAVSIPDQVIGVSNCPSPSRWTMGLGSTQSLTEMSTRNLPGGERLPARKVDNLIAICEPIVKKIWEPRSRSVRRIALSSLFLLSEDQR
jgi:hypothetical protein